MPNLNMERKRAAPVFGSAALGFFGGLAVLIVSVALQFTPLGYVGSFCMLGSLFFFYEGSALAVGNLIHGAKHSHALRTMPEPVRKVQPTTEFAVGRLPTVDVETPDFKKGLLAIGRNYDTGLAHLKRLEAVRHEIYTFHSSCQQRYRRNRKQLEAQQLAAYRIANIARSAIAKFDSRLPAHKARLTDVPVCRIPAAVTVPSIAVSAGFEARLKRISRLHIPASSGAGGVALAVGAKAVLFAREEQKVIREAESATQEIRLYRQQVAQMMEQLGRSHDEIVDVSAALDGYITEMRALLPIAEGLAKDKGTTPIAGPVAAKMRRLELLALVVAPLDAARNL